MDISKFQGLERNECSELKCIFGGLVKNGDSEKFFRKYVYTLQQLNYNLQGSSRDFPYSQLHCLQSKLLKTCQPTTRDESVSNNNTDCNLNLSDREKAGLQYTGGYVLQKIHNRLRTKASHESQQAGAILKAGKRDRNNRTQNLVNKDKTFDDTKMPLYCQDRRVTQSSHRHSRL